MIKLKLLSNKIKKPFRSRENILAIYSPKKYIIPEADAITIDTEINVVLPLNRTLFVTTKFKGQKIKEIRGPQKKRLRITLLNHSYFHTHTVEKGSIVGYLLSPNSEISIENAKKKKGYRKTTYRKRGTGKNSGRKRRRQTGGFLSRYDFAYAGRDVVNQAGKVAPGIISKATADINKIAKQRIDQVIRNGGAELERVAPKIIRGAIEEVYKTPFCLLGNLGKKQFQKINRRLFK